MKLTTLIVAVLLATTASAFAQQVTKKEIAGISTFAQVETTIACGGATKPEAIREIAKMGFKSVVNLRLASEQGAMVEEEGAAGHQPKGGTPLPEPGDKEERCPEDAALDGAHPQFLAEDLKRVPRGDIS